MIEAAVFDLDGVLIDSEPVWEQVRREAVAGLVLTRLDELTPDRVAALGS